MVPQKPTPPDTLGVIENALSAALREVRRARAQSAPPQEMLERAPGSKSTSNVHLCFDVLEAAGHPLHVTALVAALDKMGVKTSRDSLVSALTKQLLPKGPFIRTAPNTFDIARRVEHEG